MTSGWLSLLHRWRPFDAAPHVVLADGVEVARVDRGRTTLVPIEVGPHELVVVADRQRSAPLRVVVAAGATTTVRSQRRRGELHVEQLRTPHRSAHPSRWTGRAEDEGAARPFVPLPPADAWLDLARRDRVDVGFHVVWLDGQQVAGLPYGSSVRLPVPSGRHLLLLTLHDEAVRSPPEGFALRPGETVRFASETLWTVAGNVRRATGVRLERLG